MGDLGGGGRRRLGQAAAVGLHVLTEKVLGFVAVDARDVPVDVDSISTDWLTAVLCRHTPGARVVAWDVVDRDAHRSALRLRYNVPGRVAGLPEDLLVRSTPRLSDRLQAGTERRGTDLRLPDRLEVPAVYWAAADLGSGRTVRLVEDVVATRGAVFLPPGSTLDPARASDVLAILADVHGATWSPDGSCGVHGRIRADHVYVTVDGTTGLAGWTAPDRGAWSRDVAAVLAMLADRGAWQVALAEYLDGLAVAGGAPPAFDEAAASVSP